MRTRTRLMAMAATGLALSTVVSAVPGAAVLPIALAAPASGRVLFAGTQHRSLGVATATDRSEPLLGLGPTHFDDQPSATGARLVFTSRRDAPTPQVYLRDAGGAVHRLTTGLDAGHPRLSPDGTLVAFDSAEPGPGGVGTQRDLWLVGSNGRGLLRLTDGPANESEPTFSPDGTQLAFTSDAGGTTSIRGAGEQSDDSTQGDFAGKPIPGGHSGEPAPGDHGDEPAPGGHDPIQATTDIFQLPVTGGPSVRLTFGGGSQPAWNPVRADRIAYAQGTGDGRRLRLIEGGTEGIPVLAGNAEDEPSFSPAWQADGTALLFVSIRKRVNQIFEVPCTCAPNPKPTLLLDENRGDDSPTSLSGQLVVARSTADDQSIADLQDTLPDGTDPRDLGLSVLHEDPGAVNDNFLLFHPNPGFDPWLERQNYSPDGSRLAVTRFETVGGRRIERIWLADADGGNAAPMPLADRQPGAWEIDPSWSPDGRLIIFTRQSPGAVDGAPTRIFIADVATGQVTGALPPSADPALSDAQPEFSPDGDTITFTRVARINGSLANKHIWLTSATALGNQTDLTAAVCGADCPVIDDSPAFSPDGLRVAFNREHDGLLMVATNGTGCRVLLPAGQTSCAGPIDAPAGPFQPRDIAFSPDGTKAVLTTRRAADRNSPEMLAQLDIASGTLTPIDPDLPGRQKEPSWQHTIDLSVTAPARVPVVLVNSPVTVTATVTNHGPAPSLGTTLTLDVPPGLRLDGLTAARGICDPAARRCDLGTLTPGGTVAVTANLVAIQVGAQPLTWSVRATSLDVLPANNTAVTVVPVRLVLANPALAVVVAPAPGYVGGTVTLTFTARNDNLATATGLTLTLALPAGVPVRAVTAGCMPTNCALSDLTPGTSTVVTVVLAPNAAIQTTVSGTLRTTGTDANPADDTATAPLIVLQPKIIAVPPLGKPGFVTSVRGTNFPPGVPVTLTWTPGITATAAPIRPLADGAFIAQLLILTKDETGPRIISATGPGFGPVTTPFLVVTGNYTPPDLVARR